MATKRKSKATTLKKSNTTEVKDEILSLPNDFVREMRKSGVRCLHLNLRRAVRTVDRHFDFALEKVGLTANRFNILMTLGANPMGMELAPLAQLLVYDRSTLLRNLEPLEESNWIRDIPSDTKRARKIALTQAGIRKLKDGLVAWNAAQSKSELVLGGSDYSLFLKKLRILANQENLIND
ncbi:MAG TPA: MarR family transcriptional regulator [Leptospiraceae bacterium]|nr:MarR family transcriptional regulator [Leptospiraceae bacterium]HMW05548.1 MarR family transcriptional regulator [Leptospiraceae bacterium]HMX32859.1 MarR family transcriptional regulator [Leptospiraceae bacterium]HMY31058.1 MarR family transcriptional regulator [Leptospiraceae bacterium]HMZ66337.1 MarR family transcriptional regulator [Leptospiraceae bacterium]